MQTDKLPRCLMMRLLTGSPATGAVLLLLVSFIAGRKLDYHCDGSCDHCL